MRSWKRRRALLIEAPAMGNATSPCPRQQGRVARRRNRRRNSRPTPAAIGCAFVAGRAAIAGEARISLRRGWCVQAHSHTLAATVELDLPLAKRFTPPAHPLNTGPRPRSAIARFCHRGTGSSAAGALRRHTRAPKPRRVVRFILVMTSSSTRRRRRRGCRRHSCANFIVDVRDRERLGAVAWHRHHRHASAMKQVCGGLGTIRSSASRPLCWSETHQCC